MPYHLNVIQELKQFKDQRTKFMLSLPDMPPIRGCNPKKPKKTEKTVPNLKFAVAFGFFRYFSAFFVFFFGYFRYFSGFFSVFCGTFSVFRSELRQEIPVIKNHVNNEVLGGQELPNNILNAL